MSRTLESVGGLELLDRAVRLLRAAPATCHLAYLVGTVPFLLALLLFWSDMARSALAEQHVLSASLGVALLYLWMKAWQGSVQPLVLETPLADTGLLTRQAD